MTKFRPCIDLHDGKVKQIVGSTLNNNTLTNYIADKPSAYFSELYKRHNLTGGHVIMLGPNNEDACLNALKVYPMQVGGGIKLENCKYWIDMGATHVIVTSYLFDKGKFQMSKLKEMAQLIGHQKIVVDLSCKRVGDNYYVCIDKWQTITDMKLTKDCISQIEGFCDELLIHATHIEGMQKGMDTELIKLLGAWCTNPCTYAGGATSLQDLSMVDQLTNGKLDVTIGSALDIFGGSLSFEDCAKWRS